MRIISKRTLRAFWESDPRYLDAKGPLEAGHEEIIKADWDTPQKVKAQFRNASVLKDGRVVFNIKGNDYRLVVWINYPYRVVYIRFVGTHEQYDKVDVERV
jgi:mRNA interferase HigB